MVIYGYFYMCNWMCIALSRISFIIKWVMTISFFFSLLANQILIINVDTIHSSTWISKWQFNDNGLLESNDNFEFVKKISEWRPTYLMCTLIAIHNLMKIQRNAIYFKGVLSIFCDVSLCFGFFFFIFLSSFNGQCFCHFHCTYSTEISDICIYEHRAISI